MTEDHVRETEWNKRARKKAQDPRGGCHECGGDHYVRDCLVRQDRKRAKAKDGEQLTLYSRDTGVLGMEASHRSRGPVGGQEARDWKQTGISGGKGFPEAQAKAT